MATPASRYAAPTVDPVSVQQQTDLARAFQSVETFLKALPGAGIAVESAFKLLDQAFKTALGAIGELEADRAAKAADTGEPVPAVSADPIV